MFKIDSSGMQPDEASTCTCMYNINSYRMQHGEASSSMTKKSAVVCNKMKQVPASSKLIPFTCSMTKQVPVATKFYSSGMLHCVRQVSVCT